MSQPKTTIKRWLLLSAALTLSACAAHGTRPTSALTLRPQLPPNALIAPAPLPTVAEDAGLQELVINHVQVAGMYHALAARYCALLGALDYECKQ